jgi:hypothetical protein
MSNVFELPTQDPREAKTYAQPSVRTDLVWTPSRLTSAMVMADSGHYRMLADLSELIMADDRAGADLLKRVRSISGTMPVFQSSGDGRKGAKVARDLGSLRDGGGGDWWEMLPEAEYGEVKAWGIVMGFGIGQLVWKKYKGRDIPTLEPWHPRLFRQDLETGKLYGQERVNGANQEFEVDLDSGKWFLYSPYGRNRAHARGLWRGLAPWWLLKKYAIGDWGRHSENASTLVGSSPKGATKAHRAELASNLYSMAKNAVVVLPPEFNLKLVEATANTRDIYDAQIQSANLAMTIAITGVNLPTHATGGSYAAMTEQSSVATAVRQADAEIDATQTRAQVLKFWALYNHGSEDVAPWPHWDVRRPEEKVALADAMSKFGAAITALKAASPRVDAETILEDAGIPLMSEAELEAKDKQDMERRDKMGTPEQQQANNIEKQEETTVLAEDDDKFNQEAFLEDLSEATIQQLAEALQPQFDELSKQIDAAETIDDIKSAVLNFVDSEESPEAIEVLERAMLLVHLAGTAAAMQGE